MNHGKRPSGEGERPTIMIVDDEKINIDVLTSLLKADYRIIAAKTGAQAQNRLQKGLLPDLILLDISMPELDGYEVCRQLKEDPRSRDVPVIFITSRHGDDDEVQGFEVGAVDYIRKPFHPLVVRSRIKTHIDLKRHGDMLKQLAIMDGLTGIANRRRFDQFVDYEWSRSLRYQHNFSLIMLDIDYFKRFNDCYGHAQGDQCLKQVAYAISQAMPRPMDLAARYGGEEFACVLPETSREGAVTVANRVLQGVQELRIAHAHSNVANHVTVSVGIASMVPRSEDIPTTLLARADQALYHAKNSGRNQLHYLE
ncbi:response regulator receiver modulated diguanylate cyclase [Magnetococcus marinus MC-1]|uniref:diguanylate cyclase n=1 Tax=Magnetococcus marinus (strain ATCC BAA-1437 / JCM 17883 / MC-1) TaxID=156889 RepID=A0LDH0_MAGMM|nr:diguanylate cyclase [Magnetococcus marinus]ABK46013.1 response regulator receiver modulated diguanylate cyclase [Magnetococcus marinus MC-1]